MERETGGDGNGGKFRGRENGSLGEEGLPPTCGDLGGTLQASGRPKHIIAASLEAVSGKRSAFGNIISSNGNFLKYFLGTYHGKCGFVNPKAKKNGFSCSF